MLPNSDSRNLVDKLRNRKRLPPLTPENVWHPGLNAEIAAISPDEAAVRDPDGHRSMMAWKALLYLWNDNLDDAHELVQDLETPTGSALHGILHRREGDYDNAKYWFRRTGDHPAFHGLQARAAERIEDVRTTQGIPAGPVGDAIRTMAAQGAWNPYLFTDAVAMTESGPGNDDSRTILEQIQLLELEAFHKYLESRLMD